MRHRGPPLRGCPGDAAWFDEGLFTQPKVAGLPQGVVGQAPAVEDRTGDRWPESPLETPVEGFLEEGSRCSLNRWTGRQVRRLLAGHRDAESFLG